MEGESGHYCTISLTIRISPIFQSEADIVSYLFVSVVVSVMLWFRMVAVS